MSTSRPRLVLITPQLDETAAFAGSIEGALAAGDVAAVLLRLHAADERTLINRTKLVAAAVQRRDIALLLDGHPGLVARAGADGAHLTGLEALQAALPALKPDRIAGSGGLRSRHDAMLAGETNADYVMFGEPERLSVAGGRPPFSSVEERVTWWAELFQPPCIGYAANAGEIRPLVQAGADFIALGEWIWNESGGAEKAIAGASRGPRRRLRLTGRPTFIVAATLGALCIGLPAPASAQQASPTAKPHSSTAKPTAPPAKPATSAATPAPVPGGGVEKPDLAFGAFQRGYYITAFALATQRAADQDDPKSMTLVAELYANGLGVPEDDKKAADWYKLAAARGDANAMFALAMFRMEGRDGARDRAESAKWLAAAAKLGHPIAAYDLALLYMEGELFPQDFARAAQLLRIAAQAGNPQAQYALGTLYKEGRGVAKDPREAVRLFALASLADEADAEVEYGIALFNGVGVERNQPLAASLFHRAALKANPIAQDRLALILANGLGVKADPLEAAKWHLISKAAGETDLELDDFVNKLDAKTRAAAEQAAKPWIAAIEQSIAEKTRAVTSSAPPK